MGIYTTIYVSAAAAKSLQSCPTLCNPIDISPPGSPIPGILQARTLEWICMCIHSHIYFFLPSYLLASYLYHKSCKFILVQVQTSSSSFPTNIMELIISFLFPLFVAPISDSIKSRSQYL